MNRYFEQLSQELNAKSISEVQTIAMTEFGISLDEMVDLSKEQIVDMCVAVEQDACFS